MKTKRHPHSGLPISVHRRKFQGSRRYPLELSHVQADERAKLEKTDIVYRVRRGREFGVYATCPGMRPVFLYGKPLAAGK